MTVDRLGPLIAPLAPLTGSAWLVGGGLRDALLERPVADVDVAVDGDAATAARELGRVHNAGRFELSRAFGAWRVQGGRLPFTVDLTPLQGGSLVEDLRRRDFTINALALPVRAGSEVVDLHGGLVDLAERRLRLVSPDAFRADPVRLLRAARMATQLDAAIDEETIRQARTDASLVWDVAPERLAEELRRTLRLDTPVDAIERLDDLGVLGALVPAFDEARGLEQNPFHHRDVLGHTLEVVRGVSDLVAEPEVVFRSLAPRVREAVESPLANDLTFGQALVLAALLHDVAKPATREERPDGRVTFIAHDRLGAQMSDEFLARLRMSNRLREFVTLCVRQHLPLGFMVHRQPLSLRQIVRYLGLTAPAEVELIVLSVADRLATRGPRTRQSAIDRHLDLARQVLRVHFEIVDRGTLRPPISGDELAGRLGRNPGPWLAELLAQIREEQLVGRISTAETAVRFSQNWVEKRIDL